jgi:aspartyl-tRNA synthetase
MYEWNEEDKKIDFSHNPFSMPQGGWPRWSRKREDLLDVKAYQYDIVCNGVELSSGAIRNHLPDIMYKAFAIAGYGPEVLQPSSVACSKALSYGAPRTVDIAPGIDRIVMLLAGASIRAMSSCSMNSRRRTC